MSRVRIIVSAVLIGAVIGIASPLLVLIVLAGIAALIGVVLAVRAEARRPTHILLSPTPWVVGAGSAVVFSLISRLGWVLGLLVALVLAVVLIIVAGDID